MTRCTPLLLSLAASLACGNAMAQTHEWPIDAARSQAQFSVRTLWFTHVRGTFGAVNGSVRGLDPRHDVVDAWIDAGSLAMGDQSALQEARGPRFFDVQRYPRIHFVSAPFPLAMLAQGGALNGELELHGERHPAQFTLLPSACPAQPLGCPIRVEGALSRGEFGMHEHRALLSDRVSLNMNILLDAQP